MRAFLPLSILLLASACGQESRQPSPRSENMPASGSADAAAEEAGPPGISVTAAPGVAFNYRYNFRLPAERVSEVQEQHAAACEKLGVDRCRITGMLYRLINDRDREAMLAFKLDPAIARQFGKAGIETVTRADGLLTESEITGEDAGSEIAAATRTAASSKRICARSRSSSAGPALARASAPSSRHRRRSCANRSERLERHEPNGRNRLPERRSCSAMARETSRRALTGARKSAVRFASPATISATPSR